MVKVRLKRIRCAEDVLVSVATPQRRRTKTCCKVSKNDVQLRMVGKRKHNGNLKMGSASWLAAMHWFRNGPPPLNNCIHGISAWQIICQIQTLQEHGQMPLTCFAMESKSTATSAESDSIAKHSDSSRRVWKSTSGPTRSLRRGGSLQFTHTLLTFLKRVSTL